MTDEQTGHRRFAAFWDWAVRHEGKKTKAARQEVVGGARGAVLELGVGVGANWTYLPAGVEYSGIEPDPHMIRRAQRHAIAAGNAYDLRQARAEELPFQDSSFDTVIVTLTLCSVADVAGALGETRRVLRPGGQLRFFEHVRARARLGGTVQDLFAPAWRKLGAGCNLNRRTEQAIRDAGFEIVGLEHWRDVVIPMVTGVARAPLTAGPGNTL